MSQQRTNPNRKIYIIAGVLWLTVVAICVGIFVFFGSSLFRANASRYVDARSIYMTSATEGWAIGVSSPFSSTLDNATSINRYDPDCVGIALHYTETIWMEEPIPGCMPLDTIAMTSADDGWAAGLFSPLIHYSGGKWIKVDNIQGITDTSRLSLRKVSMNSSSEGWAVGTVEVYSEDANHETPILLHYANGQWRRENNPPEGSISDLSMISDGKGWATAYYSTRDVLLRYDKGAWTKVINPPISRISHLAAVSSDEIWMVGSKNGYDSIWRYKSGTWSKYDIPHSGIDLIVLRLQMISPTAGWALGDEDFGSKAGKVFTSTETASFVLRYDGSSWQKVDPPDKYGVQSIYGISAYEAWATGFNAIWHYKDGNWNEEYSNFP